MVERGFEDGQAAKTEGFSGDQIHLSVETLHHAARKRLLRLEPVEDQLFVTTDRADKLLHRIQLRAHRPRTPLAQEPARPVRTRVRPEELKALLEKIRTHTPKIVLKHILQARLLGLVQNVGQSEIQSEANSKSEKPFQ